MCKHKKRFCYECRYGDIEANKIVERQPVDLTTEINMPVGERLISGFDMIREGS